MPAPKRICTTQSGDSVEHKADSHAGMGSKDVHDSDTLSAQQVKPTNSAYNFYGLELQDLLVVEICAGSARLTKTVRKRGLRGLAIDKSKDRGCGTEIMILDLTLHHDVRLLLQILATEASRIALVFISPPCGTASKARERPIRSSLLGGRKQPEPLRSKEKPDQKDGLSNTDKVKTELANQLYDAVSTIVLHCHALELWVMIENPRNSL